MRHRSASTSRLAWARSIGALQYAPTITPNIGTRAFLKLLGVDLQTRSLRTFCPLGGPQWDGLGRAASGEVILVEAKAHLNELYSPATGASEASLMQIQHSLRETAHGLGVRPGYDWSKRFYQYGNRLAHEFLLDRLNVISHVTIKGRSPLAG
jgi:hypothetical protein